MENEIGAAAVLEFARSVLSEESVKFFLVATRWRRANEGLVAVAYGEKENEGEVSLVVGDTAACKCARSIITIFLTPGADEQVNLPASITSQFASEPAITLDMFDAAIAATKVLVRNDTFDKFCRSASGIALAAEHADLQHGIFKLAVQRG